jgi:hypothetical protein
MAMLQDVTMVYETVRQAILDRRSLNAVYDTCIRYFSPHVLGKDSEGRDCVVAFQYAGKYPGGLPVGGMWCCFRIDGLHWLRANGDRWLTGSLDKMPDCVRDIDVSGLS